MEREKQIEKQKEREDKVPNMPQMFLQTIRDPQGTERKRDFIMCLNETVCDLFLCSQRTEQSQSVF